MTKIILHGALGRKFGREHNFLVRKPIDAIRALIANKKGFKKAFKTWGRSGKLYEVICDGKKISGEKDLLNYAQYKEMHFAPIIAGSSDSAKAIIGAVLMVVSFIWNPAGTFAIAMDSALMGAGASLFIGGVMGLLFPPQAPTFQSEASAKSFIFSTLENAAAQGVSVPLGYGRLRVGTKVISTSVEPQRLGGGNKRASRFSKQKGTILHRPLASPYARLELNGYWNRWDTDIWFTNPIQDEKDSER